MKQGVYKITNVINDKCYIGSSVDITRRWRLHKQNLRKGVHCNILLQNAWNKYGEDSFIFEILEYVLQGLLSKSEFRTPLLAREQYYKDLYRSYDRKHGYDICKIAGSCLGVIRSEETRLKQGIAKTGINNYWYGKKHSKEDKRKQFLAKTGENNSFYGRKHTLEWKIKRSELMKNKWNDKEYREKMMESR